MDDVRRQDIRLFVKELLQPWRLLSTAAIAFVVFQLVGLRTGGSSLTLFFQMAAALLMISISAMNAWTSSEKMRFSNKRMGALWEGCHDRMMRFEDVLARMRKDQVAELKEMPKTIRTVADSLYLALRRADMIMVEVQASEKDLVAQPPAWQAHSKDPQSRELYRQADRNIAEYRAQYAGVMAGVQRTEAQSAVFMTTVDTLRMKLLGYRLVGRSPELPSQDFLEALAEARAQLQAIDTALDELDLGHYPKQISVVPPPPPSTVYQPEEERLELRDQ